LAGGYLLYFVMHPDYFSDLAKRRRPLTPRNTKKIILIDTLVSGNATQYNKGFIIIFRIYKYYVKRYIETNKLYKGRYKLAYL